MSKQCERFLYNLPTSALSELSGKFARDELRQLFDIYDLDRSGTLTVDELRAAMSSAYLFDPVDKTSDISSKAAVITTTDFERIVASADMNGDAQIDFEEWCEMMRHFFED